MFNLFLGVDISKDSLDYCLVDSNSKQLAYSKEKMNNIGFTNIDNVLKSYMNNNILIIMESTGNYHFTFLSFLLEKEYNVTVVNPVLINNFIKASTLRKSKNDKRDAFSIANFGSKFNNNLHILDKNSIDSLKPIIRERESIVKLIARLKTEIKSTLNLLFPEFIKDRNIFTKTNLTLLKVLPSARIVKLKKLKKLTAIMNKATSNKSKIDPEIFLGLAKVSIGINNLNYEIVLISKINRLLDLIKEINQFDNILEEEINENNNDDFRILKSIKGIGDITAKTLLIEINNINNFSSSKQLTAYFGTDPAIKQSGSSIMIKGKISKRGNNHLRRIIWLMAVCTIRSNLRFHQYFIKKRVEGMAYKKAVIATGNKLIRTIYGILKNRTEFILE